MCSQNVLSLGFKSIYNCKNVEMLNQSTIWYFARKFENNCWNCHFERSNSDISKNVSWKALNCESRDEIGPYPVFWTESCFCCCELQKHVVLALRYDFSVETNCLRSCLTHQQHLVFWWSRWSAWNYVIPDVTRCTLVSENSFWRTLPNRDNNLSTDEKITCK